VLAHLEPLLDIQAKHGIVTQAYGALTPLLRHPTGGPLKPILNRIAERISTTTETEVDASTVLILWTRAQGVVVVTASGNPDRIKGLGKIATLPDLLTKEEIDEITAVGKKIHYRYYVRYISEWKVYFLKIIFILDRTHGEGFPFARPSRGIKAAICISEALCTTNDIKIVLFLSNKYAKRNA